MSQEDIPISTTKQGSTQTNDIVEQKCKINNKGDLELIEEQHLLPDLKTINAYIPLEDTKEELQYWLGLLNSIESKFNECKKTIKEESKVKLGELEFINRQCNDLFNLMYDFYINKQNNEIIKYWYDIDKLSNEYIIQLKELCLKNMLINEEFDFYHQFSILGKIKSLKNILYHVKQIYEFNYN